MNSGSEHAGPTREELLARPEYAKIAAAVERRAAMVEAMVRHATQHGLLVTEELVSRQYDWFYRWHIGLFSTGYLMSRTGVKRRARNPVKGKWV